MSHINQPTRRPLTRFYAVPVLLLLMLVCGAAPETAQGQWAASGNNDITNMNTGNVGVGTVTPAAKLDVNGSATFSGVTTVAGRGTYFLDGSNVLNFTVGSNSVFKLNASSLIYNGAFETFNNYFGMRYTDWNLLTVRIPALGPAYFNQGNVGIGTTDPLNQLHVRNGSGPASMRVSGAGLGALNFIDSNAAANAKLFQWRSEGGLFRLALVNDAENAYVQPNLLVANSSGNIGIGMTPTAANKLEVAGSLNVSGTIRGGVIEAKYQDVAEWTPSSQTLEAGTVVALDPEKSNQVLASSEAYDTKVAGVVSAQPGIALGERGEGKVLVATTGRVKVKVDATRAAIKIGDLLVTSDKAGVAMKSEPISIGGRRLHSPGTLIGKALESLANGTGEILVLLSLQ